ncbi:DNA repair protein RecO [Bacteroidia bacterium]|nr:DNA repair protein RecO [Bacteroidia bacterium]
MLYKTRGIILHSVGYSDAYSIVQIFTEEFGRVSYLTSKSKGKKTKVNKSLFYPLSVLDLEVEHLNLRDIHRIKEAKPHRLSTNTLFDPVKSSISIFLSEFISKVVKDIQPNPLLFNYICDSIRVLDLLERGAANFHLVFIFRLSRFLGFYPDMTEYKKGMFFDLQNGEFVNYKPFHPYFLNPDDSEIFALLMRMDYSNMHSFKFSHTDRINIINKVLEYYRLHLTDFPELKSLEVLQNLFATV